MKQKVSCRLVTVCVCTTLLVFILYLAPIHSFHIRRIDVELSGVKHQMNGRFHGSPWKSAVCCRPSMVCCAIIHRILRTICGINKLKGLLLKGTSTICQCFRVCLKIKVADSSNFGALGSGRLETLQIGVISRMRLVLMASDWICSFSDLFESPNVFEYRCSPFFPLWLKMIWQFWYSVQFPPWSVCKKPYRNEKHWELVLSLLAKSIHCHHWRCQWNVDWCSNARQTCLAPSTYGWNISIYTHAAAG